MTQIVLSLPITGEPESLSLGLPMTHLEESPSRSPSLSMNHVEESESLTPILPINGVEESLSSSPIISHNDVEKSESTSPIPPINDLDESGSPIPIVSLTHVEYKGNIITKEMINEESNLAIESEKSATKLRQESYERWAEIEKESKYKRLNNLLKKSSVYANFLINRIEKQRDEKQKQELQKAKRKMQTAAQPKVVEATRRSTRSDNVVVNQENKSAQLGKGKAVSISSRKRKREIEVDLDTYINRDQLSNVSQEPVDGESGLEDQDSKPPLSQSGLFTGGTLRDYQLIGVDWMLSLYENGMNGILADEMGLGKTIQVIETICRLEEGDGPGGRGNCYLIVAPLSTLSNWVCEFERFAPSISTLLYHGDGEYRKSIQRKIRREATVIITSYEIVIRDQKALECYLWRYIVVDEAQRIKNMNCSLIRGLKSLRSLHRLLLTGTPLQNNLAELWSLLNFLLPDVFDNLDTFESWFTFDMMMNANEAESIVAEEQKTNVLSMLHRILTPFMLRRIKADVSLDLPPKEERTVLVPLTPLQRRFYEATVNKTIEKLTGRVKEEDIIEPQAKRKSFNRALEVNRLITNIDNVTTEKAAEAMVSRLSDYIDKCLDSKRPPKDDIDKFETNVNMRNAMMQLRKICSHPYLIQYPLDNLGNYKIDDNIIETSGKVKFLERILPELKSRGHKVLLFSQMTKVLDIIEDYCIFKKIIYQRLDGRMSITSRQEAINDFNQSEGVFLFLISTRAGGLGINLASADTVILYDSDWNPQCDLQAQDRCHRIGQTKPVVVYRLVVANSIDQRMVERATAKRRLEKLVIKNGLFKGTEDDLIGKKLNLDELLAMLKSDDSVNTWDGDKDIPDDELFKLLCRDF